MWNEYYSMKVFDLFIGTSPKYLEAQYDLIMKNGRICVIIRGEES